MSSLSVEPPSAVEHGLPGLPASDVAGIAGLVGELPGQRVHAVVHGLSFVGRRVRRRRELHRLVGRLSRQWSRIVRHSVPRRRGSV